MDNIGGGFILPRLPPMGFGCCPCGDCNGVCFHRRDFLHTHMPPSSFRNHILVDQSHDKSVVVTETGQERSPGTEEDFLAEQTE